MPLTRYLIRNEYGLADPQVYREVEKDDPEALLEGLAMAGLIGILRQLGDLADVSARCHNFSLRKLLERLPWRRFAADLFHNLHEEIMTTSARGHGLVIRVQQLEVDLPSVERALLTRTDHLNFAYTAGIDWHCNRRDEHNLVIRGDLPRFLMESYEECHAPPPLFLLDKFDVAGAGACLKRFSDPSIYRMDLSTSGSLGANTVQSDKRPRRLKKGLKHKNGETLQALLDSQTKHATLFADTTNAKAEKLPRHVTKLKIRQVNGYGSSKKKLDRTYMEQFLDTAIAEDKNKLSLTPSSTENPSNDAYSISKFHDKSEQHSEYNLHSKGSPSTKKLKDVLPFPSTEPGSALAVTISRKSAEVVINGVDKDQIFVDGVNNVEIDAKGDFAWELETYMDALVTIESELEADSPYRNKNEVELFAMDLRDIDSDTNGDQLQQPSEIYDSHFESSPASYGSTDRFEKENLNLSSTDTINGLMNVRSSSVAKILPVDDGMENPYSVLDSENMIELKGVSPVPCDGLHLENIEGRRSSSVDGTIVSSFTCRLSSSVAEMSTIFTMLPERIEQNCVESSSPNTIGDVLQKSIQECCTTSILDANELPCQKEGFMINTVQSPLPVMLVENTGHNKSPVEEMIHEACVEDTSSTSTSEMSSASFLHKSPTFACAHKESCMDEVQSAYASFQESNPKHKSLSPEIFVATNMQSSCSSQMSGEASCAPLVPSVTSNVCCPSGESSMDKGKIDAPVFFPDDNGQDKCMDSAVFCITNGIYCDHSSSNEASGVLCVASVVDTASVASSYSPEESTVDDARTIVSVMSPGGTKQCKFLVCDKSDKTGHDLLGCANLLPESQESSCTASSFEGTGKDLAQVPLSEDNETSLDCEAGSVLDPPRMGVTDKWINMTDSYHLADLSGTGDKISTQFHDNLIIGNDATGGLSKTSLLMKGGDIEQREADMSGSKNIISSPHLIDLCSPCDLVTGTHNTALYDENLKILPEAIILEGETLPMDSESVEIIANDILLLPSQSNTVDPTPVVPEECDIKESAEANLLSPAVHYTLTENHKLVLNRSSNETSTEGTTEEDQLYSVRSGSVFGDSPTKIVVNEMKSVSEAYGEDEALELLPGSNGNLCNFTSKPISASIEGFPDYVDIEPVSVVTKTVEPEGVIEDKHISDEIFSPKITAIKVPHPRGTASESMLSNMALEATPLSDISDLCSSDCCRLEETDGAREILCGNERLHLEGDRHPCQAEVDQQPDALPEDEPDSGDKYGRTNCSVSHESLPLAIPENMYGNIGYGSHESRPGDKVLDSEENSSSCATLHSIPSGIIPYQQNSDTFGSVVFSHDKSDPEISGLSPVSIFHSSQVIGHDIIVTDVSSYREFVQYPSTCVSVREYNSDLDEPVSNDYTEAVVESVSVASNEKNNLIQHEFHAEQVSMVPVVAVTARHELQRNMTPMHDETQQQDQCDISEECSNSMQSNNLYYTEFKNSNNLVGFGDHHGLPENERENTVSIPAPATQTDLNFTQKSSIKSADVMPSLYTDDHTSIFELPRMENLREPVKADCHNTYEGYDVQACSPSATGIASLAASSREFMEVPESSQTKQNATSISIPGFCLSDVSPMTSAFYSSCAPIQPETAHVDKHGLGEICTISNSSDAPVLPQLGNVPEWTPPLPLPPMEWIMGKPRFSFFLNPAEASEQPTIISDTTMTEAAHSNGTLPWKRRSLYKRSKDPLIQAVASHDKSKLKKVPERAPLVSKPKSGETVALHDKSRLRKVTGRDGIESKPKPDEPVLSHDKSRLKKVAERDLVYSKPKADEAVTSDNKFRLRKVTGWESVETKSNPDEAVIARLKKVTEPDHVEIKSKPDERDVLLEQIRAKSFNLKPTMAPRPAIHVPTTNIKVAAILEKAKAIRQAHAGTGSDDEDDDTDTWSDA